MAEVVQWSLLFCSDFHVFFIHVKPQKWTPRPHKVKKNPDVYGPDLSIGCRPTKCESLTIAFSPIHATVNGHSVSEISVSRHTCILPALGWYQYPPGIDPG